MADAKLREELVSIIDGIFYNVYSSTGLSYSDEMVDIEVDKILQAIRKYDDRKTDNAACEKKQKWKKYRDSINWGPDGWPIDNLTPPA